MKELSKKSAKKIHEIIMSAGSQDLIDNYKSLLKSHAEMRNGFCAMSLAWCGTEIETEVKEKLKVKFKFDDLYSRNLISEDGRYIELNVLIQSLPDEIVMSYFEELNAKKIASQKGIDYEQFIQELQSAYKGSVGKAGTNGFALLFDCSFVNNKFGEMQEFFGLGMLRKSYDRETLTRLSSKKGLSPIFKMEVQNGLEVLEKGLELEDVYIITQLFQPYAVKTIVKALGIEIPEKKPLLKRLLKL